MITIFEAIINNNLERVKFLIEKKYANAKDLEPDSFIGKEANIYPRANPKTALELAEWLKRGEIVDFLRIQ
ncbi:MAG: hypothetical protein ACRC6O_13345 [Flavobacterium sp.]